MSSISPNTDNGPIDDPHLNGCQNGDTTSTSSPLPPTTTPPPPLQQIQPPPSSITKENLSNILNYNIPFPVCEYSQDSHRNNVPPKVSACEQLAVLDQWHLHSELAIDGQNGTTKSSLARSLQRNYRKINDVFSQITSGPDYNHNLMRSLEYLSTQLQITAPDSVWDRCPYSNLIFYLIHALMAEFRDRDIPMESSKVWPILNSIALSINLCDVLVRCKHIKPLPILFMVCSDLEFVAKSMIHRGQTTNNVNDIWNAKEFNYQMAQFHVYKWFGRILQMPVIDIAEFLQEGFTIGDIHTMIATRIDRRPQTGSISIPKHTIDVQLFSLLQPYNDDVLVYDFSKK